MKGISNGIRRLHNPFEGKEPSNQSSQAESQNSNENGCHGDLKPTNILLFYDDIKAKPYGTLRISDAGLVKFYEKVTSQRVAGTTMASGTEEYAPPEFLYKKNQRTRAFDMWSLGCIFLEFVIWIRGGRCMLQEFRRSKKPVMPGVGPSIVCPFYEGTPPHASPHPKIHTFISSIRKNAQEQDDWLCRLLDIIEKHLLIANPLDRFNSKQLDDELKAIIQKINKRPASAKPRPD